jgi:hypothetical protein
MPPHGMQANKDGFDRMKKEKLLEKITNQYLKNHLSNSIITKAKIEPAAHNIAKYW